MQIQLREMRPEDWPEVRQIYEEGLATGIATLDTEVPDWHQWDENHIDTCRIVASNCTGEPDSGKSECAGRSAG